MAPPAPSRCYLTIFYTSAGTALIDSEGTGKSTYRFVVGIPRKTLLAPRVRFSNHRGGLLNLWRLSWFSLSANILLPLNKHCLSQVATQVKWARSSGALPAPDPDDLEPPKLESDADERLEPIGRCPLLPFGATLLTSNPYETSRSQQRGVSKCNTSLAMPMNSVANSPSSESHRGRALRTTSERRIHRRANKTIQRSAERFQYQFAKRSRRWPRGRGQATRGIRQWFTIRWWRGGRKGERAHEGWCRPVCSRRTWRKLQQGSRSYACAIRYLLFAQKTPADIP